MKNGKDNKIVKERRTICLGTETSIVLIINYVDELDVKEIQVLLNFFSLEDDLIKVLRRQYSQMGRIFNPRKMFH
jgi:hypothetical protein